MYGLSVDCNKWHHSVVATNETAEPKKMNVFVADDDDVVSCQSLSIAGKNLTLCAL